MKTSNFLGRKGVILMILLHSFLGTLLFGASTTGPFGVLGIGENDASSCTAEDGEIEVNLDPSNLGVAPYDVSIDNGATWEVNDQTPSSDQLSVTGLAWGSYTIAVRDAGGDIVYPGYAKIEGCEREVPAIAGQDFSIAAVVGVTGYTWTTTVGSLTSGQNTTRVTFDFSGETHLAAGTICVQPTGPTCTAPETCFDVVVQGVESNCFDGIDNDGDGLTDCADCSDCTACVDSDGDGISDVCDLDDDNDGIPDLDECPFTSSGLTGPIMTFTTDITTADASDPTESHILNSITYEGTTYSDFILPDRFASNFSLTAPDRVRHRINNATAYTYSSSSNFDDDIISAFNTRDLGSYLNLDANDFSDGDYYDLLYNSPVISTDGGFIAITERLGNNVQIVQPLDVAGLPFGNTVTVNISDYVDQNVVIESSGTQRSEMALFPIEDFAPLGSRIYGLRTLFGSTNSADGPDSKVFIFGDASALVCDADNDGVPNHLDLDSDNDGIFDAYEAGHAAADANTDGIIDGAPTAFGANGLFDGIETSPGSGVLNFNIKDSETVPDGTYDAYELDSDGDTCFDTDEQGLADSDEDGVYGAAIPAVNLANGLVLANSYGVQANVNWQDSDIADCRIEICNNGIDDDGDGLADCADQDCPNSGAVTTVTNN